ncbi:54S ribosomal protein L6-like protein [Emericellopsis cladophorae]|uniref:54S ribosomal protein L6-like protein n=1 Tax=Emericellopsis cladophorae TaxID=2686198 RepID=A0A9P9Y636_9HYPO|nr:54S ribosomal protein L6-like protein [Emericellopsis cladophorae]KAI6784224.1 54S ribosomal protein L6-like protein [Emericellopsis cladophorae]
MAASFAPSRSKALGRIFAASSASSLPEFLVPAWRTISANQSRLFSATSRCPSKLGRTPITIPQGVTVTKGDLVAKQGSRDWKATLMSKLTVNGPLGQLSFDAPEYILLEQDLENKLIKMNIEDVENETQKEMWGTSWKYLSNCITGVSEGHSAILRLVGVGYRATVQERRGKQSFHGQQHLILKLGFTHTIEEPIPAGLKVTTPQPTRILIEGTDKVEIMSFAGRVKQWRKPEPYKGKGIFINDETIKLKSKKIS